MSIQTILTWTSFMIVTSLAFKTEWDQETRDYILKIHNEKRRGEKGCNMNKLVYDQNLEEHAKRWAKGCIFEHELKDGRGENLYFSTFEYSEKELIKGSTQSWFDEKNIYSYGQYSCGLSCHYTQMVWWSTQMVGCYSLRCPTLKGEKNAWYLVCFYLPMGNMNGEKPYEKSCAKKCKEGQTEDNGLCVGEAKGGSTSGGGGDGVCKDDNGKCENWAMNRQCEVNAGYMLKNCRKSCKVCFSKDVCEDSDPRCEGWAKTGSCENNPGYMLKNCKKSCNVCVSKDKAKEVVKEVVKEVAKEVVNGDVKDVQDSCESREKKGECANNPTYMSKNCKTSCKICLGKDSCDDLIPSCSCWAKCGECEVNPDFMIRNCKKSCKKC